jgi:uncharacterized membrane protein
MTELPPPFNAPPPSAHLHPRIVPWRHALAWYEDAMRLFKRAPATWAALAVITIAAELAFEVVPGLGPILAEIVAPLVACGLIYAAASVDRGGTPSVRYAVEAFRAPAGALVAIVASALVTFMAEAFAAWWIADANLLDRAAVATQLRPPALLGIYTIGMLASLPVMFVPFHALLERVAPGAAFVASWNAFALNTSPLLVYAAASLVLLGFGLATMGLGLVLALPLWAASSYAAWKDIFGVRDAPEIG